MSRYKYITTEVKVDLSDFDTDDLIEELESREVDADAMRKLLEKIWLNRRTGKDYQNELDNLIYGVLGKVV